MSSNTGTGLQSLFPENLFRGIHEFITKTNGLDFLIHRGSHNIPYGFMGLVTLTAGAFTYVTYQDYATEVSSNLSEALDSVQSSELFIPADQDSLKDSVMEESQNSSDLLEEVNENTLDNAVENTEDIEKEQSISADTNMEKEMPKESDTDDKDPKKEVKRIVEQDKEIEKTKKSPKVHSETDEPTKTNGGGKKSGPSKKKTVKHRKAKK